MIICIRKLIYRWILLFYTAQLTLLAGANNLPKFLHDMNNLQISERTQPGTVVYRLLAEDIESEIYYSINDTDVFDVDSRTGIVKLTRFLNKNLEPEIKFTVICEDLPVDKSGKNIVSKQVTAYVVDQINSNAPSFVPSSLTETTLPKDLPVGTVINTYRASDIDSVGQPLTFVCGKARGQQTEVDICKYFTFVYKIKNSTFVEADLVLFKSLANVEEDELFVELKVSDAVYSSNITLKISWSEKLKDENFSKATMELPAFVTELEETTKSELFDTPIADIIVTSTTGTNTHMTTDVTNDDSIVATDTTTFEFATSAHSIKFLTTPDVTHSMLVVDATDEPFGIEFIPSKIVFEIVENWPVSFPLPINPRLGIKYDSPNPLTLSVQLLRPKLAINSSFTVEPPVLYADRNFDIVLENASVIDRELYDQIELLVSAIDETTGTKGELMVSINVLDVNDNEPKLSQKEYNMTLEDDSNSEKLIGRIWASDSDTDNFGTNGIVFHLLGPFAKYFRLEKSSRPGSVELFAHPCDEKISSDCLTYKLMPDQLILVIRATDTNGTGLFTDAPLTINLIRMNHAKPKFDRDIYFAKLREKETTFDPLLILEAHDEDTSKLIYGLDDPTHLFGIDNETGMIFVSKPEHVTIKNLGVRFHLTGTASDGKNEPTKIKITVEIIPGSFTSMDNQPPSFISSNYFATVPPNAPEGYVIINVIAKDPEHQPIQYYLTSGGSGYFSVKRETGEILFKGAKFMNDKNFTINVLAVDNGSPQGYSSTTVSFLCLGLKSSPPQFEKNVFTASIFENATVGTLIEAPQIIDEDALDGFLVKIISIEGYNEDGQRILTQDLKDFLEYQDDALVTKRSIYDKGIFSIHLEMVAYDIIHPLEDPAHVFGIVNVIQIVKAETELFNFLGVLPNQTVQINISSDTPIKAFIYHIRVFDKNPNSVIIFTLKNDSEYFSLNEKTGLVTLKKSVTKVNSDIFLLEIEAKNLRIKQTIAANLMIHVIEKQTYSKLTLNQESYSANVVENVPTGSFVFRFSPSSIFCQLYNFNLTGQDATYFFADEQGRILTASKIDRELRQIFSFNIEVSCKISLTNISSLIIPAKAPVIVNVLDLNDNPPMFDRQNYSTTIQETSNVDSYVLALTAKDPDSGVNGTIMYSLNSLPDELQDRIVIDAVDGQIKTSKILLGLSGIYKFFVIAVDGGNLNTSVPVNLLIQSFNKCQPKFISSTMKNSTIISIKENENPEYLLATFKAVTEDQKCAVKYTFRDQSTGQAVGFTNEFQIDPDSGELKTKKVLDREQESSYKLILSASDSNRNDTVPSQMVVKIVVLDENDNRPTFQPPSAFTRDNCSTELSALTCWFSQDLFVYNFSVYENEPTGTILGKLLATDPDEGDNGTVFYHLISSMDSSKLSLDLKSGLLKTKFAYDREKQEIIEAFVTVTNSKAEPNKSESDQLLSQKIFSSNFAKISVNILDRNDHGPSYDRQLYLGAISYDTAPETLVIRIRAVDPDISGGGIYYRLKKAEYHYKKSTVEEKKQFSVDSFSGEIRTKMQLKEFSQGYFQLVIDAFNDQNQTNMNLTDSTIVKVWIFEPDQLVRIVINDSPLNITDRADSIAKSFGDSLGANVVLQQIEYDKDKSGIITANKVDLLAVFIDRTTEEIMSSERVINLVDKTGIHTIAVDLPVIEILPAKSDKLVQSASLSGAAIALIVFGCILFLGLLAFMLLLCYLKYSFIQEIKLFRNHEPPTVKMSPSLMLSAKENPLWNEVEKKPYEEQELSLPMHNEDNYMKKNVIESVNPNILTINSVPEIDVNSTYAKIHKPLSSRYSQNSSLTDYDDGTNLYQSLRK